MGQHLGAAPRMLRHVSDHHRLDGFYFGPMFAMHQNRSSLVVRRLGLQAYTTTYGAMQEFTRRRTPRTPDEVWLLEHPPVFTLGQAGRREHVLDAGSISVLQVDRGGQVTYHGPGQLIVYVLLDLRRKGLFVRELVAALEQAVVDLLKGEGIPAERRSGAPGVYVDGRKIGALGLRLRGGCCYHGFALNVDMALEPFRCINPCGYEGLEVTQLADLGIEWDLEECGDRLLPLLTKNLGYPEYITVPLDQTCFIS